MNALISIWPEYTASILTGEKAVELRGRRLQLLPGATLWIYSTMPRGRVETVAQVSAVLHGSPHAIWKRFATEVGLTRSEFIKLFGGKATITAISLIHVRRLKKGPDLASIRERVTGFQPPQFITYLKPDDSLLGILEAAQ